MRTSNIEISFKIKYPCDKPDLNGCIYTKEAIKKAVEKRNMNGHPIFIENDKGCFVPIGIVQEAECVEEGENICIVGNGLIRYGGTCEIVNHLQNNKIVSMEIDGIGFTRE